MQTVTDIPPRDFDAIIRGDLNRIVVRAKNGWLSRLFFGPAPVLGTDTTDIYPGYLEIHCTDRSRLPEIVDVHVVSGNDRQLTINFDAI